MAGLMIWVPLLRAGKDPAPVRGPVRALVGDGLAGDHLVQVAPIRIDREEHLVLDRWIPSAEHDPAVLRGSRGNRFVSAVERDRCHDDQGDDERRDEERTHPPVPLLPIPESIEPLDLPGFLRRRRHLHDLDGVDGCPARPCELGCRASCVVLLEFEATGEGLPSVVEVLLDRAFGRADGLSAISATGRSSR